MKKILYLMHIPWGVIKHRPHFIAEYLSKYYKVNVFHKKVYKNNIWTKNKISNDIDNIEIKELFRLPFERYILIQKISSIIIKFQLKKIIKQSDIIWFTHPNLFTAIKDILPKNIKIIYDCMDDAIEFFPEISSFKIRKKIINDERELMKRSNIVFTSSNYLKRKLISRYNIYKKIYLINNAIFLDKIDSYYNIKLPFSIKDKLEKIKIKLIYIGAISKWMNLELIIQSLKQYKEITYIFFGLKYINLPKHDRLLYFGPIENKYIFKIMGEADALIMPFKVNELVLSVDPIKLYEYIFSGKPSISIKYGEALKFKEYIYLYKNKDEYFNFIKNLIERNLPPKKSLEECRKFTLENTWKKRTDNIINLIETKF